MPIYCFVCEDCGARAEAYCWTRDDAPEKCDRCGGMIRRDYGAESRSRRSGESVNSLGDHHSLAFQFLPEEAPGAMEKLRKHPGCACIDIDEKGRVVTHSIAERRALIKAHNAMFQTQVADHDDF